MLYILPSCFSFISPRQFYILSGKSASRKWNVRLSTGDLLDFDFIIVANGHYRVPRYPDTPGLSKWIATGKKSHSAWYRHPHNLVRLCSLSEGPSGMYISAEMSLLPEPLFIL